MLFLFKVVVPSMSEELAELFSDATILRHEGGHFVPATAALGVTYTSFLRKFLEEEETTTTKAIGNSNGNSKTSDKKKVCHVDEETIDEKLEASS